MVKEQIVKALQKASGQKDVQVEYPEREEYGDYSSNVALKIQNSKNPKLKAREIVEKLKKDKELSKIVDKIEIAGPGFINFYLKTEYLQEKLLEVDDKFGGSGVNKGKKIMVEFAHPNTHKSFHIGHLRNITTGESISRILESTEIKIIRTNYQGDVGLHIAKALWGIKKNGFSDPTDIDERVKLLGKAYVDGNKAYEDDEKAKEEIININKEIYEKKNKEIVELYNTTRNWSLNYFDKIYKRVYTKFDRLYFESEVADLGKKKIQEAVRKGVLIESEGAIIFPGEKYQLHNRVFLTSKGVPTYEGKDLGLAEFEFSEFKPDKILHVVGPEQATYFQVLFKVLGMLQPKTKDREVHVPYGWVKLKEGKMSSRKGNVVLGEWLLDEVKARVQKKFNSPEELSEMIAVGAVKYSFLKVGLAQEIAFSIDESISIEGNSGPYIQYTYARTRSVLANSKLIIKNLKLKTGQKLNTEELAIMRTLVKFPEVVEQAATSYSPNVICNYIYDLASKYNTFYNKHKIIGSENEGFRIKLTEATGVVLKSGLNLLGIKAPEKM